MLPLVPYTALQIFITQTNNFSTIQKHSNDDGKNRQHRRRLMRQG